MAGYKRDLFSSPSKSPFKVGQGVTYVHQVSYLLSKPFYSVVIPYYFLTTSYFQTGGGFCETLCHLFLYNVLTVYTTMVTFCQLSWVWRTAK